MAGNRAQRPVSVYVASNSGDRSDLPERVEDLDVADVSRVEDVTGRGQSSESFGTHETVRVADDAYGHSAG